MPSIKESEAPKPQRFKKSADKNNFMDLSDINI